VSGLEHPPQEGTKGGTEVSICIEGEKKSRQPTAVEAQTVAADTGNPGTVPGASCPQSHLAYWLWFLQEEGNTAQSLFFQAILNLHFIIDQLENLLSFLQLIFGTNPKNFKRLLANSERISIKFLSCRFHVILSFLFCEES
jgi:hypothetical protein